MILSGSETPHTCEELTSAGFPSSGSFGFASQLPPPSWSSLAIFVPHPASIVLWVREAKTVPAVWLKKVSQSSFYLTMPYPFLSVAATIPGAQACAQVCPPGPPKARLCQLLVTAAAVNRTVICTHSTCEFLNFYTVIVLSLFFYGQVIFKR